MAEKSADKTGEERRRHPRTELTTAVLISPNGHHNATTVYDMSASGARVGLPLDFEHREGARVRLFFPRPGADTVVLNGRIARVAIDHLGIDFDEGQETVSRQLLEELSGGG
jgi:hypothetical protein